MDPSGRPGEDSIRHRLGSLCRSSDDVRAKDNTRDFSMDDHGIFRGLYTCLHAGILG